MFISSTILSFSRPALKPASVRKNPQYALSTVRIQPELGPILQLLLLLVSFRVSSHPFYFSPSYAACTTLYGMLGDKFCSRRYLTHAADETTSSHTISFITFLPGTRLTGVKYCTMTSGRLRDNTCGFARNKYHSVQSIFVGLSKCRSPMPHSTFTSISTLLAISNLHSESEADFICHINRTRCIGMSDFSENFDKLSDQICLSLFRFRQEDMPRVVSVFAWKLRDSKAKHYRYAVNPLIVSCLLL